MTTVTPWWRIAVIPARPRGGTRGGLSGAERWRGTRVPSPPSDGEAPAVAEQYRAHYVRGLVRGEIGDVVGELVDGRVTERAALVHALADRLGGPGRHRRVDRARRHGVDADAEVDDLLR